jgi:predicted metal-dependent phosphoesterase TrpH
MEVFAVCHAHSNWSYDGSWTLEKLSAKFRKQGCRILMMTEHDRGFSRERLEEYREACAKVSSDQILVVPGIEYSDADNRVHVLVWGPVPLLGEALPTNEMLEAVRAANGVAVLAHPSRKKVWESFSPYWAERLLGIEMWNRKYDGWAPSETSSALLKQSSAIPFVGLDFHTDRQLFSLSMALEIDGLVCEDEVLKCLRSRRCFPRVFGKPLDESLFLTTLPALKLAERGRRTAASIARRARIR